MNENKEFDKIFRKVQRKSKFIEKTIRSMAVTCILSGMFLACIIASGEILLYILLSVFIPFLLLGLELIILFIVSQKRENELEKLKKMCKKLNTNEATKDILDSIELSEAVFLEGPKEMDGTIIVAIIPDQKIMRWKMSEKKIKETFKSNTENNK